MCALGRWTSLRAVSRGRGCDDNSVRMPYWQTRRPQAYHIIRDSIKPVTRGSDPVRLLVSGQRRTRALRGKSQARGPGG